MSKNHASSGKARKKARHGERQMQQQWEQRNTQTVTAASRVLDEHTRLHGAVAHPSELYKEFVYNFAYDARSKDDSKHRNISDGMFYPYRAWLRPDEARFDVQGYWLGEVAKGLFQAQTYQVTEEMVDAVTGVYRRGEGVFHLQESEMPSPHGFVWLDKPLEVTDKWGHKLTERAFSWSVTPMAWRRPPGDPDDDGIHNDLAVRIISWNHIDDPNSYIDEGIRRVNGVDVHEPLAPELLESLRALGPLTMSHTMVVPFGERHAWHAGRLDDGADSSLAWLHALWMFMDMEIVATRRAPVSRATARRSPWRNIRQGEVSVVLLRRIHSQGEPPEGSEPRQVDWSCSWLVQGHWRHLEDYKTVGFGHHHAVPGRAEGDKTYCATCLAHITWVRPHIKGPDGLPLKASKQLIRLAR